MSPVLNLMRAVPEPDLKPRPKSKKKSRAKARARKGGGEEKDSDVVDPDIPIQFADVAHTYELVGIVGFQSIYIIDQENKAEVSRLDKEVAQLETTRVANNTSEAFPPPGIAPPGGESDRGNGLGLTYRFLLHTPTVPPRRTPSPTRTWYWESYQHFTSNFDLELRVSAQNMFSAFLETLVPRSANLVSGGWWKVSWDTTMLKTSRTNNAYTYKKRKKGKGGGGMRAISKPVDVYDGPLYDTMESLHPSTHFHGTAFIIDTDSPNPIYMPVKVAKLMANLAR